MAHLIERVPGGAASADATINHTAKKMRAESVGSTADVVWMQELIAELATVQTSVGPVVAMRRVWPTYEHWRLADHVGLTTSQADTARKEVAAR